MAINYARLQTIANKLITENGRSITLIKQNRTAADPAKPWRGAADLPLETAGTPVTAVFVALADSKTLGQFSFAQEGTIHKADSDQFFVSGKAIVDAGIDLTEYDTIQDGTEVWRITSVDELKPGSTVLLYYLNVSR